MHTAPLTIGIEEEYQLIDPATGDLAPVVQEILHDERILHIGDQVKPEFLQSQIEVGSDVCRNVKEARMELQRLRREVNTVAQRHGYAIIAASTHPFAHWEDQVANTGERYEDLQNYMQEVARQMLICGMHVHIGFGIEAEQLDLLIDIQNQLRYFLPHILTFSTSSPFWQGHPTGLKSYRSIIFENLPRTGIPPHLTPSAISTRPSRHLGAWAPWAKSAPMAKPTTPRSGGTRAPKNSLAHWKCASVTCAAPLTKPSPSPR